MPPPPFAEQLQQQQMLGTILEEDWMDDDILYVEEEEQRRRAFRAEQMKQQQWYLDGSGRRGGRVGRMVDWWMGRGERWPDPEQQQDVVAAAQQLEEMVTLAKTTIELTPPLSQVREGAKHHGVCRGDKNLNNNASPTRSPIGKRSATLSLQNRSGASTEMPLAAPQNEQCHGSEVNVSLQVVREHNITVSASCCFAEQKMPLLTSAREIMPLCRPNMSSNGSRTEMRKKSAVDDGASVKKLGLRIVDIQLEDGLDDCHWGQEQCRNAMSNNNVTVWAVGTKTDMSRPSRSTSLASTNKTPPKKQKQTAQQCIVSSERKGNESRKNERAERQHGAAPAAAQQTTTTTTGWTQFKLDREQRERREHGIKHTAAAAAHYRHPPKSCPSHHPAPTFSSSSSSHSSNFSSSSSPSLSLLSPLCSPPPLLPWLNNISNGSSSGVGSSVSSVSPKSTDGEGERDSQSLANGRMEQFRHATSMHRRGQNGGGDYRVISLDMRPEPGRLEDFVPEVERAKAAAVTKIANRRTNAATAALSDGSVFDARLVREERNYDLQRMDCLRRSWQRRVSTTAVVGGRGGGTLPAVKREGRKTDEKREWARTDEAEVDDEETTLRRDEWGRVIVGQREWRQFMAEQRTPSSRRVKSQIRLLNDNNGRKTPTIVTMDDGRTAEDEQEEAAQEEQFSQLNEEKQLFDNGTCPPAVGQAALLRIGWQRDECGVRHGTKLGRTVQMPPADGNGPHGWPISTIFGGFPSTNFDYHHHTVDGMTRK
uniref:SH2 domain-containing protein n=1 Tax=Globodera pallida TaxID=36090 RepID=A0A183CBN2_GLOPA